MTYRTKVRYAEAFRWTGQPCSEWPVWATPELLMEPGNGRYAYTKMESGSGLYAYTKNGPVHVQRGDWLILGDKEIYPCTDEEFRKRYEEATPDSEPNIPCRDDALSCGHASLAQCDVTCLR